MNKKYKETFSTLRPTDDIIESIKDIPNRNKKKSILLPIIAVASCFVVLIVGAFGNDHINNIVSNYNDEPVTNSSTSISKVAPGGVIVAFASDEAVDVMGHDYSINVPMKSKIGAIDIRGKSQAEIDKLVDELYEKYDLVDWNFPSFEISDKNVLTLLDVNTTTYDNAIIYQFRNGFFDFDLDSQIAKNVKEIRVKNESPYARMRITSMSVYYQDGKLRDNYGGYSKGIHYINIDSNDFVGISGEEYQKDVELSEKFGRLFGISWEMSTDFVKLLNENPNYDLSQISDTVTFEVEFNDGTVSQSVVNVSLDKNGYMYAKANNFCFKNAQ